MRFTGHQPNGIVRLSNQNTKKSVAAREYLWIDRLFLKSYLLRCTSQHISYSVHNLRQRDQFLDIAAKKCKSLYCFGVR